ncbi:MAG: hypothetical protein Q4D95_07290, partial [Peptoniphilus sp.]|nr:hypothetical protein [Peptoniphilus sp.]
KGIPLSYFEMVVDGNLEDYQSANCLSVGENSIILSNEKNGRLVVSLYPVDWIRDDKLFKNILYYALFGTPQLVAVYREEDLNNSKYNMLCNRLSTNNKIVKHIHLSNKRGKMRAEDETISYFCKTVNTFIFPDEILYEEYKYKYKDKLNKNIKFICLNLDKSDDGFEKLYIELNSVNDYESIIEQPFFQIFKYGKWIDDALIHDINDLLTILYDLSSASDNPKENFNKLISSLKGKLKNRAVSWLKYNDIKSDSVTALNAMWILKVIDAKDELKEYLTTLDELKYNPDMSHAFESFELMKDCIRGINDYKTELFLNEGSYSFGEIIRILDIVNMGEIVDERLQLNDDSYLKIFHTIKTHIESDLNFFEYDSSNLMSINRIVKFLISLKEEQKNELSSDILLNLIYNYLILYKEKKDKVISCADAQNIESGYRVDKKEVHIQNGEKIAHYYQLQIINTIIFLIESKYPIDFYKIIENIEIAEKKDIVQQNEKSDLYKIIDNLNNKLKQKEEEKNEQE